MSEPVADIESLGALACELLEALRPWDVHGARVKSAATALTLALAAIPPPDEFASERFAASSPPPWQ